MLAYNYNLTDENINESKKLGQTNGVLQGDQLSPILISIWTADVIQEIQSQALSCYMHAYDTVITSRSKEDLQDCLNKLINWADTYGFKIDRRTTVIMFRKGGRVTANDNLLQVREARISQYI
jgi:hypothetical protein